MWQTLKIQGFFNVGTKKGVMKEATTDLNLRKIGRLTRIKR